MSNIKFIDLFAGLGGIRIGFEQACHELGLGAECVFTSEIKPHAVQVYQHNFGGEPVHGDITKIDENDIPDFDFLLGGFPCQAFSAAGKQAGFDDTRGTLFFDVARILKAKMPHGFLLENVDGLVSHDKRSKSDEIGNTLSVILNTLESIGYHVTWKVLDAKDFGVPQSRKRIYIVGNRRQTISMDDLDAEHRVFGDIRENGLPALETRFTKRLLELFTPDFLQGKSIKDRRGGHNNIHSWDLELKGRLTDSQKQLMRILLKERRKKQWAEAKGIAWMDGMPLTLSEIHSFFKDVDLKELQSMLNDLTSKKYLRYEHPKDIVVENGKRRRAYAEHAEKGYNIVSGKLSFELNIILDDNSVSPTIVATEADRIGVIDGGKLRKLSERECLRFCGFPEWYRSNVDKKNLYDLIGNTVAVPVVKQVAIRSLLSLSKS